MSVLMIVGATLAGGSMLKAMHSQLATPYGTTETKVLHTKTLPKAFAGIGIGMALMAGAPVTPPTPTVQTIDVPTVG